MTADDAIAVLHKHQRELRARGVRHAAIFGSVARGQAGPHSDLDILIELDPGTKFDVFAYAGLKRFIAGLYAGEVDVVSRERLKPHLRKPGDLDVIQVF